MARLWTRWKRVAHRAAAIQSLVLLTVLYWLTVVPIGTIRRLAARRTQEAGWRTRPPAPPPSLEDARRQS